MRAIARRRATSFVLALAVLGAGLFGARVLWAGDRVVFEAPSVFGKVRVVDRADGVRVLGFGDDLEQSAMVPGKPDALVYEYTRTIAAMPAFLGKLRRVLVVGVGGGTLPGFLLRHFPNVKVDAVDIDPAVVDIAHRFFELPKSKRLRVEVGDGRWYVEKSRARYDLIILDAYGAESVPPHLATIEFLHSVRRHLTPGGGIVANLHHNSGNFQAMLRTFQEIAGSLWVVTPPGTPMTRVVLAFPHKTVIDKEKILQRLGRWHKAWSLPFDLAHNVREGLAEVTTRDEKAEILRDGVSRPAGP